MVRLPALGLGAWWPCAFPSLFGTCACLVPPDLGLMGVWSCLLLSLWVKVSHITPFLRHNPVRLWVFGIPSSFRRIDRFPLLYLLNLAWDPTLGALCAVLDLLGRVFGLLAML